MSETKPHEPLAAEVERERKLVRNLDTEESRKFWTAQECSHTLPLTTCAICYAELRERAEAAEKERDAWEAKWQALSAEADKIKSECFLNHIPRKALAERGHVVHCGCCSSCTSAPGYCRHHLDTLFYDPRCAPTGGKP